MHNCPSCEEKYSYYEDFFFLQRDIENFPDNGFPQDSDTDQAAPKAYGKLYLNR